MAKVDKEAEWQEKIKSEYANKKTEWLKKNGYNKNEVTFIYFPKDSFEIKEELKENNFVFDKTLLWHCATIPEGFEDKVFEVAFKDIGEYCPTGEGSYYAETKEKIAKMMRDHRPAPASKWLGEEKERLYGLEVKVTNIIRYSSYYGESSIVVFITKDGNICKWFTSVSLPFTIGDEIVIDGTIKELVNDKYEDNAEVTILTRCKVKE